MTREIDERGEPGPLGAAPANYKNEGYWYACDNCDYEVELLQDEIKHRPCPECKVGILHER